MPKIGTYLEGQFYARQFAFKSKREEIEQALIHLERERTLGESNYSPEWLSGAIEVYRTRLTFPYEGDYKLTPLSEDLYEVHKYSGGFWYRVLDPDTFDVVQGYFTKWGCFPYRLETVRDECSYWRKK